MVAPLKHRISSKILQSFDNTDKSARQQLKQNNTYRNLTAVVEGTGPNGLQAALRLYSEGIKNVIVTEMRDEEHSTTRNHKIDVSEQLIDSLNKLGVDTRSILESMSIGSLQGVITEALKERGITVLYGTRLRKETPDEHQTGSKRVKAYLEDVHTKEEISLSEPDLIVTASGQSARKATNLSAFGIQEFTHYQAPTAEQGYKLENIVPNKLSGASLWMFQLKRKVAVGEQKDSSHLHSSKEKISHLFNEIKNILTINKKDKNNQQNSDVAEQGSLVGEQLFAGKTEDYFGDKKHDLYEINIAFQGEQKPDAKLEQELVLKYVNEVCGEGKKYKNIRQVLKDFDVILPQLSNHKDKIETVKLTSVNSLISKASGFRNWVAMGDFVGTSAPDEGFGTFAGNLDGEALSSLAGSLNRKNNTDYRNRAPNMKSVRPFEQTKEQLLQKYSDEVIPHHIEWAAVSSERMQEINPSKSTTPKNEDNKN
jgi:hypothetical protein